MPDPFISNQDLTDYLGRDVTADPGAIIACDAACDIVRAFTEQQINQATSTVALDGTGTDSLLLYELPVTTAGSVTVDGGTVTDYTLNGNGILFRGTALSTSTGTWPAGRQNIRVTFQHGWAPDDIPRDIRVVALSIAARLIVQGVASEESMGDVSLKYAAASTDLTNGEKAILRKYRPTR